MSKVLFIADEISEDALEFLAVADNLEVDNRPGLSIPEKLEAVGKADALIVRSATKVDAELLEAADILEHEEVYIYNLTNGSRLSTY
ncbi:MAG: aspartate 1-decarboxylase, partial [Planctomycetes bacterium]|nr:aspartate 1-decarboxylase [Planctomycetota bacterium]